MTLPVQGAFLKPTLEAFRERGSLRNVEVDALLIESLSLSEEEADEIHSSGRPALEVKRNLAIHQLNGMGLIERSRRGVYSITQSGREVEPQDFEDRRRSWNRSRKTNQSAQQALEPADDPEAFERQADEEDAWKAEVTARIVALSPTAFERLIRELLLEAGFSDAQITGRGSDDGIDGMGEYSVGLTTQSVVFQAKKYEPGNLVSAPQVRDFQGALGTDSDVRGLFITTSSFTLAARDTAAPGKGTRRVQLIDGYDLCDLMREYGVGVKEVPTIDEDWFAKYETDSINDGHSERTQLNL